MSGVCGDDRDGDGSDGGSAAGEVGGRNLGKRYVEGEARVTVVVELIVVVVLREGVEGTGV